MKVTCESLPLLKILLHASKHPSCTVNGVLLGSEHKGPGGSLEDGEVKVTDIMPLFHASNHLAAPTEVALAQVDAHTQQTSSSGTSILGYYHSDARMQSVDLSPAGRLVADKLNARKPSSFVLLLDNKSLGQFSAGDAGQQPFELLTKDGSRGWRRDPHRSVSLASGSWKQLQSDFVSSFRQRLFATFNDFDDHLDDVSKDPLNQHLNSLGKMALPGQQM